MKNRFKVKKFAKMVKAICEKCGYTLIGDITLHSVDNPKWDFAVITNDKSYLVKLIVSPFNFKTKVTIFFGLNKVLYTQGFLYFIKAYMFRRKKTFDITLPESAFGLDTENTEKVYVIYPNKRFVGFTNDENSEHIVYFQPDLSMYGTRMHDFTSFLQFLENPRTQRKFDESIEERLSKIHYKVR